MIYNGKNTDEISFPLGGIGTGCIGLAGNGRLIDWEIYNRPNKGGFNGMSHFAIKAEADGKVVDARILNGDFHGSPVGIYSGGGHTGYGYGPDRNNLTGVPHFKDVEFVGEFPMAEVKFKDDTFPGTVSLNAFNPFIPINDKDSTIPGAFFELVVTNPTDKKLTYTTCMSLNNPLPLDGTINRYEEKDGIHTITLGSKKIKPDETTYGELSVATDASDISYQEYWYRGGWFDNLGVFWRDFNSAGKFKNRNYAYDEALKLENIHYMADVCTLAAHFELAPGETKKVKFIVSWSFPNAYNYWKHKECGSDCKCSDEKKTWKNYYAVLFKDSRESAAYALKNWTRLYDVTKLFKDALFSSTMPETVIDAISSNISILKAPTCLRLENGEFYGWEGCQSYAGSCEGSCTHVWNYAYALPFLFPALERSMRDLDYKYDSREDGGMTFRLQLPLGSERSDFRPCADGQFGNIIKTYRDWKICGDNDWLKSNWEKVKKAIAFAWSEENIDQWDRDKDGVMEGRQHQTLDMELFGPNSWLNGMYLAALKAGAEMATALGENDVADEYMEVFNKGKKYTDTELFNGEYFIQKIDLKDKSLVEKYDDGKSLTGFSTMEAYWNDEAQEIKYQIGEGSAIDQLLGQWHANMSGLGEIFDKQKTQVALKSIFKYNFKDSVRNVFNPCRIYAFNDDAGTLICEWPEGTYKPVTPAPYCEETWPGLEYPMGILMIQEGLMEEGMRIVSAVRDRFDGSNRNPWNEFECGSNYARSMASYGLLSAFSGFSFDMVKGHIGFNPVTEGESEFFFSLDSGWGKLCKGTTDAGVKVLYGSLSLKGIELPFVAGKKIAGIQLDGQNVAFNLTGTVITFDSTVKIDAGHSLVITLG